MYRNKQSNTEYIFFLFSRDKQDVKLVSMKIIYLCMKLIPGVNSDHGASSLNHFLFCNSGRCNNNVGSGRRGLGPRVRRWVCAGGRGQLHAVCGEDEDGLGHRRGARAQYLHSEGSRQDGVVHRQFWFPEAEGCRLPVLRAQAVGVGLLPCGARGGRHLAGRWPRGEVNVEQTVACCLGLLWDLEGRG